MITEPLIVFEVVSPSSGRIDHAVKLREYRAVSSIRRYVVVNNTGPDLTVLKRPSGETQWFADALTAGDTLDLPEVGISLPVNEIFQSIAFDISA